MAGSHAGSSPVLLSACKLCSVNTYAIRCLGPPTAQEYLQADRVAPLPEHAALPRIFDNIKESLLPALRHTLAESERADLCVGYFNLRGWREVCDHVDHFEGGEKTCRLLVGMHRSESEELRHALRFGGSERLDNGVANRLKKELAQEFREQLVWGAPTDVDERVLQRLAKQIRGGRVRVKLFLRHALHAKLYLTYRDDPNNPITGFVGSSNLTFAGLSGQGELNVDVLEHDACEKLQQWFEEFA